MRRLLTILGLFVLVLAITGVASAQTDPRIGTWKLNVAKSKIEGAAPRTETRTYQQSGDSVSLRVEATNGDGSKQVYGYTVKEDGKDYPYTGQGPGGAETLSSRRVGNTFSAENKKGGKLLFSTKIAFSGDGKVMTIATKGVDASGQSRNNVRVYDKQ